MGRVCKWVEESDRGGLETDIVANSTGVVRLGWDACIAQATVRMQCNTTRVLLQVSR